MSTKLIQHLIPGRLNGAALRCDCLHSQCRWPRDYESAAIQSCFSTDNGAAANSPSPAIDDKVLKTLILRRRYVCAVRLPSINFRKGVLKRQCIIIAFGANYTVDNGLSGEGEAIDSRLKRHRIILNPGVQASSATNTTRYRAIIDDCDICTDNTGTALRTGALTAACADATSGTALTHASSSTIIVRPSRIQSACTTGYSPIVYDSYECTITNNIHARAATTAT
ncbi:hypothetical protein ABC425_11570 [Brucella melitensis]|nr:hypothetical protein [Brucella melitensis]ENS54958.1 hypothetical protein C036_03137 [Brucella melitensis F1/06 B10]